MSIRTELEGPPLLTPLQSGIFDEDVIGELEEHIDDAPGCQWSQGCDATAEWSIMTRCCGKGLLFCAHHEVQAVIMIRVKLATGAASCMGCERSYPSTTTLDEFVRVVKL